MSKDGLWQAQWDQWGWGAQHFVLNTYLSTAAKMARGVPGESVLGGREPE